MLNMTNTNTLVIEVAQNTSELIVLPINNIMNYDQTTVGSDERVRLQREGSLIRHCLQSTCCTRLDVKVSMQVDRSIAQLDC